MPIRNGKILFRFIFKILREKTGFFFVPFKSKYSIIIIIILFYLLLQLTSMINEHFFELDSLAFEMEPPLPSPLAATQCVALGDEILICGGFDNKNCYSYHCIKKEYKWVCSYPNEVNLKAHIVVKLAPKMSARTVSRKTTETTTMATLLSFGGSYRHHLSYHTLVMKYHSVWKKRTKGGHKNEWVSLRSRDVFGKKQQMDLLGARAWLGGANEDLLFVTRHPNNIDVIDINTFRYIDSIKHTRLPVSTENKVCFHCFVGLTCHQFILISDNESLLIEFDEINRIFFYHMLAQCPSFTSYLVYAYAYLSDYIFIFGGNDQNYNQTNDVIFSYSISLDLWKEYSTSQIPFFTRACAAVALTHTRPFSIHIFGGKDHINHSQNIHCNCR
ncbi:hypothetical protein RFI_11916 [Reticulomyxa filosa]|uniref:Kelch motif family protein n=1 Tax=Reticulomyxa filosa TaxID=46433 RepID=X6NIP9_RETFI|nr:hypothetical protein RFI_11916 [Reticulomyxa filosa]|eukprot:ETO25222.1 hypothetical protein RFI_11916 [Reticulomyxa filosa]